MHLLVVGATGRIGRHVVLGALARGYDVALLALHSDACDDHGGRVHVFGGDVMDASAVEAAVAGQDAVVCALESRSHVRAPLVSEGTRTVVEAMKHHGVRRLVVLSSQDGVVHRLLATRRASAEGALQTEIVSASGLDYTLVHARTRAGHAVANMLLDALGGDPAPASPSV